MRNFRIVAATILGSVGATALADDTMVTKAPPPVAATAPAAYGSLG